MVEVTKIRLEMVMVQDHKLNYNTIIFYPTKIT